MRRLAQAPPTPFIDGRKSVASRAHANMHACNDHWGPKSKGPVAACPVAPSLSATLPDLAPARASTADPIYRWSKIGPVARPPPICVHESIGAAEILRSGNSLRRRAIALGYSPRPCAGSRKHRRPRSSMVENRSRRPPAPICMQRPRGADILRSGNSLPPRVLHAYWRGRDATDSRPSMNRAGGACASRRMVWGSV